MGQKLIQSDFVLVLSVIGKLNGMLKKTSLLHEDLKIRKFIDNELKSISFSRRD